MSASIADRAAKVFAIPVLIEFRGDRTKAAEYLRGIADGTIPTDDPLITGIRGRQILEKYDGDRDQALVWVGRAIGYLEGKGDNQAMANLVAVRGWLTETV